MQTFKCGQCNATLIAKGDVAALKLKCPKCGRVINRPVRRSEGKQPRKGKRASWLARNLVQAILSVIGGIVAAVLISWFGLERAKEAKEEREKEKVSASKPEDTG